MESSSPSRTLSFLVLLSSMLIGGLLAIYLGKELTYDVVDYHYFNPYAFLHHRWNIDYWPATFIQLFRNPSLDFVTYFLITFFSPLNAVFILGTVHGLNIWLIFQLNYRIISLYDKKHILLLTSILTFVCIYSPVCLTEMGSFMGDNFISLFVLAAVLFQVICFQQYSTHHSLSMLLIFCSGLWLGMGFGLKLTAGIFLVGFFAGYLFLPIKFSLKITILVVWSLGLILGFLLFSGYWMLFLWERFQSPFFPLFNTIFHSPYFYNFNWHDKKFLPTGLMENLFFPFYFSWKTPIFESAFTDYRLLIAYILSLVAVIRFLYHRFIQKSQKDIDNLFYRWLIFFFIFSYVAWQHYFAIVRYIDVLLMLSPLVIYLLLNYIINDKFYRFILLGYLLVFISITMMQIVVKRIYPFGNAYFNIKISSPVTTKDKTTILSGFTELVPPLAGVSPTFYLHPFFPESWKFINIPYRKDDSQYYLPKKIKQLIKESTDHFYLLTDWPTLPSLSQAIQELGLVKNGACSIITSDRDPQGIFLCPVKRLKG